MERNLKTGTAVVGLLAWLALSFAVAWFGSRFGTGPWYDALAKPAWNPPSWVFGPVWTVLYILMAVAAWLVWKRCGFAGASVALGLYLMQMGFNAAWSWIFFGERRLALGFADIALLWLFLVATVVAFWRRDTLAGVLLLPYLAWVSFAATLNFTIWRMNA